MSGPLDLYPVEPEAQLGPAMRALSPMMRQFVLALLQTGCTQAKAAELAGYKGGPNTWKAMGWKLAHDSRVQAALHEEAQKLIRTTAVMAIGVVTEIAQDRAVNPKDRLKAALELLNRSGLHAQTEHRVTLERVDDAAKIEQIRLLADRLGLDVTKLLGRSNKQPVTDAEFQVVSSGPSAAGLEDLLG